MSHTEQRHSLRFFVALALNAGALVPAHVAEAQSLDGKSALLVRDAFLRTWTAVHAKIVALT